MSVFTLNDALAMEALRNKYRQDYCEDSTWFEQASRGWSERQWIIYSSFRTRLGTL